jgi:hypothetical protein
VRRYLRSEMARSSTVFHALLPPATSSTTFGALAGRDLRHTGATEKEAMAHTGHANARVVPLKRAEG